MEMIKITKQVLKRIWPIILGMVVFMVVQLMQYDSLAIVPFYALGPFIGIMQQLPLLQWSLFIIVGIAAMSIHIAWPRWYTAIASGCAAYCWSFMGMIAAGASC